MAFRGAIALRLCRLRTGAEEFTPLVPGTSIVIGNSPVSIIKIVGTESTTRVSGNGEERGVTNLADVLIGSTLTVNCCETVATSAVSTTSARASGNGEERGVTNSADVSIGFTPIVNCCETVATSIVLIAALLHGPPTLKL